MVDALNERDWAHTSTLMAQLHNVNCTKESSLKSPDDFNPLRRRARKRRPLDFESLKMRIPEYAAAQIAKAPTGIAPPPTRLIGGGSVPADPEHFRK